METPILFLVFRRPDVTIRVFEEIRKQQPRQLFIAADGGRTPEEHEQCEATRKAVFDMIDWECEVKTLFRDKNLGCRDAVSSAITWFFEHVEQGIILEEDCLPHPSFFSYCEELLDRYKDDERIMTISGDNFQDGKKRGDGDYYFSNLMQCWGWASWRRAWQCYKPNMEGYVEFKTGNRIAKLFPDKSCQEIWIRLLDKVYKRGISSWAYVWSYSIFCCDGLNILPNVNLVSNIGFGELATHTKSLDSEDANMSVYPISLQKHPTEVRANHKADLYTMRKRLGASSPLGDLQEFLKFRSVMKHIEAWIRKHIRRLPPKA